MLVIRLLLLVVEAVMVGESVLVTAVLELSQQRTNRHLKHVSSL